MKLKRTKFAALALTALMAVGATSLVASADGTTVAATTSGTNTTTVASVAVTFYATSTDLTNDMVTYTVSYTDGTDDLTVNLEHAATLTTTAAATCTADGVLTATYKVTLDSNTWTATTTVAIPKTGHTKNDSDVYEVKTAPTCTTSGVYVYTYTCTVCGSVYTQEVEVPATGHDYDFSGDYTYYALSSDNVTVDSSSTAISANIYASGVATGSSISGLQVAKTNSDGSPVITDTTQLRQQVK